jgi:hypothetical protein
MLKDTLPFVKSKALSCIFDLLTEKPEQEQNLLALLVNKLGDLDRKIASKACYLLGQVLVKHPNMCFVVVKEVERLVRRVGVSPRARYYAITFLNQIVLTNTRLHPTAKGSTNGKGLNNAKESTNGKGLNNAKESTNGKGLNNAKESTNGKQKAVETEKSIANDLISLYFTIFEALVLELKTPPPPPKKEKNRHRNNKKKGGPPNTRHPKKFTKSKTDQ